MKNSAFFFQGNVLLLPDHIPDSQMDREIPLELLREFETSSAAPMAADVFEIPALEAPVPGAAGHGGLKSGGLMSGGQQSDGTIACVSLSPACPLPPGWRTVPVRQGLSALCDGVAAGMAAAAGRAAGTGAIGQLLRAFHITQWRRESRFCGSCGAENTDAKEELARLCPACGRLEFPRISPAVITIITNGEGQALLAHNKKFSPGVYSLVAGFNEAGENLEATVIREIWEEVRIEVRDLRYIVSQPWPFPNSLMFGFSARYASGAIQADGVEIEDARWFSKDALPKLPGTGSVSRYLINRWLEGFFQ
ncbi:MAG: NAD(+) diphosphatase [Treponema sp.]|nr:NAD(+) diphosphatase [Treponema sp.]